MFVLDTNIFIAIEKAFRAGKVSPGFWNVFCAHAHAGRMCSIDKVKHEWIACNVAAVQRAKSAFPFASTKNAQVNACYNAITAWANSQPQYTPAARKALVKNADGWLVAHAIACNATVATGEKSRPHRQVNIHIPDICKKFGVHYVNLHKMMQQLGIKFP